jgi:osmotically-inducible protein OsmY
MHKPNNILESDVRDSLAWDPYVDASRVEVKADSGEVTLTGAVPTYADLLEATDAAFSVNGVTAVDNELFVGLAGEALADAVVAADAVARLDKDQWVPPGTVSVTVVDGRVTLTGTVHHHFQRRAAERAVAKVKGVLSVTNEIVVSADPMPNDVADRINRAFRRNAIIDDSRITVSTSDHTVYLDGVVGSGQAMLEAVDTAWAAPGVQYVVNRLTVVP